MFDVGTGLKGDRWKEHEPLLDICEEHTFSDCHVIIAGYISPRMRLSAGVARCFVFAINEKEPIKSFDFVSSPARDFYIGKDTSGKITYFTGPEETSYSNFRKWALEKVCKDEQDLLNALAKDYKHPDDFMSYSQSNKSNKKGCLNSLLFYVGIVFVIYQSKNVFL